jgi:hypothetical protein
MRSPSAGKVTATTVSWTQGPQTSTSGWERLKANKSRVNARSAMQSIPSDHANQAAVRVLIPPTPRPCFLPLLSQHHSTAPPSPKRYGAGFARRRAGPARRHRRGATASECEEARRYNGSDAGQGNIGIRHRQASRVVSVDFTPPGGMPAGVAAAERVGENGTSAGDCRTLVADTSRSRCLEESEEVPLRHLSVQLRARTTDVNR